MIPHAHFSVSSRSGLRPHLRLRSCITRFLLTSDGEHKHYIELGDVTIQGDIPLRTATNHELPEIPSHRPTDFRVAFQNVDGSCDVFNSGPRIRTLLLESMLQNLVEVMPDLGSELDSRHD